MSPQEAASRRKEIAGKAAQIISTEYHAFFRSDELGREASFESGADIFERVWRLLQRMNEESLILISHEGLNRVDRFLYDLNECPNRIRSFRLSQSSNALSDRNSYLNQLDGVYRDILRECPEVSLLGISGKDLDKKLAEASNTANRLAALESSTNQIIASQKQEAQDLLEKMRQASGRVALTSYSTFFDKEASSSERSAWAWLIATIAVAALAGLYLVWLVFFWAKSVPDYTLIQAVQVGGTKLALFSVIFYLLSWCGRNFRAQWHLVVVNRHRANTLNALEAFSNSAKNDVTREAILIHASSAIFSQVQTGFVPDQADAPSTPSILEIVRGGKE